MPIGNDIIDLDEASKHRPQYYERLKRSSLAEDEWLLNDLPNGNTGLWLLWSLKEATYKSLVQGDWDGRRFYPNDFHVTSLKQNTNDFIGEIVFNNRVVRTTTSIQNKFLHTVTLPENDFTTRSAYFECPGDDYEHQSGEVRNQAIGALADSLNLDSGLISIEKNEDQVPQFYLNEAYLSFVDLSLSHHGRYGAYAMVFTA